MDLPDLSLALAFDAIAAAIPDADADAVLEGRRRRSWAEYETNAGVVAAALAARGVASGTKVAFFLRNHVEYLEAQYACFKLGAIACNVNFRYIATELSYLLENADAEVVVFSADLIEPIEAVRDASAGVTTWVQVGGELSETPDWAVRYEALLSENHPAVSTNGRTGADLWFLYTGGTTGLPKAVMWEHAALIGITHAYFKGLGLDVPSSPRHAAENVRQIHKRGKVTRLGIPAPLIHGTANLAAQAAHLQGGCVVMLESPSFDATAQLEVIESEVLTNLAIVGDAFGRPLVEELERARGAGMPYDVSSLRVVQSAGVMWSSPIKERFRAFQPKMVQVDALGSSEGTELGSTISRTCGDSETARFALSDQAAVFTEEGNRVEPGSGESGLLAASGPLPLGYYKDPEKTAATYRVIDGRRWAIAGDWATVETDGMISLLGRGSVCINTGGEKVFPEEVEEALKTHPAISDCNVVGIDDPKWGQRVVAVIEAVSEVADTDFADHAHAELAGYKVPKLYVRTSQIQRHANGKPDYMWAKSFVENASADSLPAEYNSRHQSD